MSYFARFKSTREKPARREALNMTAGTPWRILLKFALPLLLGNVLQQLYNIVDSMIVGHFVGTHALAAVGTSFPVIFLVNALFMGVGMGATIIISQYFGAGDLYSVKKAVDTTYLTMFAVAIPITILGLLISRPLLVLMNTPADTLDMAAMYMQIIFLGTIATYGYNINSGILQGLGDSRSPVLYLALATVLNILLDLLFVIVFNLGVAGVAWATILSQMTAFIFGIYHINHQKGVIRISFRRLLFERQILFDSVRLGLPAALQNVSFSLGTLVLQSLINSYQAAFMAGFNAASKIDAFAFLPIFSFSTAVTTFVGQNIGAGKLNRVRQGIRSGLIMASLVCIFVTVFILLFTSPLIRLFSQDPAVILAGEQYLIRVVPFYVLLSMLFILNGAVRGAGEPIIPMVTTTLSLWLVRVPMAYYLADRFGRDNMFFSFPLGWMLGLMIIVPYYFMGHWDRKSIVKRGFGPVLPGSEESTD